MTGTAALVRPETGGRTDESATRRLPAWALHALALVIVAAATAVMFRPAVADCGTTILGSVGDATAGGVWTAWSYDALSGPPWPDETPYTGAPEGERWWQPHYVTSLGVLAPSWALAHVVSPPCAWSISLALGFVATGMAVYAAVRALTRRYPVAILAMLAFTFSPYRQLKAEGHIGYVHTYLFPLLVLTALLLWREPSRRRAVAAGLVLGALGYVDGYFLLLGPVAFALLHLGAIGYSLATKAPRDEIVRLVRAVATSAVVALVVLVPVALTYATSAGEVAGTLRRTASDLETYGARAWEYVVPAKTNPLFDQWVGEWRDRHLHGSNYSEQTLFLGWSALAGAIATLVVTLRNRGERRRKVPCGTPVGLVVVALTTLALGAALFSGPSTAHVGDVGVPMPARAVSAVLEMWRVYARFFIVVHLAVVLLATMALDRLLDLGWRRLSRAALVVGVAAVLVAESVVWWTPPSWDYRAAPSVYRWLSEQPVDVVAEYPLHTTDVEPNNAFLTWQPIHGKPLLNTRSTDADPVDVRRGLFGLGDPQTLPALRTMGVDLVLVRRNDYVSPIDEPEPDGLVLERTFSYADDRRRNPFVAGRWPWLHRWHDVDVYRVAPGPGAPVVLALLDGFYWAEPAGWKSFRWMRTTGDLEVRRLEGRATRARVEVSVTPAFGERRTLTVVQRGAVMARFEVDAPQRIAVEVDVGVPFRFEVDPPGAKVSSRRRSTDGREIALGVGDLAVVALGP